MVGVNEHKYYRSVAIYVQGKNISRNSCINENIQCSLNFLSRKYFLSKISELYGNIYFSVIDNDISPYRGTGVGYSIIEGFYQRKMAACIIIVPNMNHSCGGPCITHQQKICNR